MNGNLAFGDNGERIETVEFDFDLLDAVEETLAEERGCGLTQTEVDAALKLFEALLKWQWQSGMKNPDGVKIRAIICCWIFLKALRPLNLTQLAEHYGMDKQSFGRWVDDFKLRFPHIRTVHMRNLETPAKPEKGQGGKGAEEQRSRGEKGIPGDVILALLCSFSPLLLFPPTL